MEAESKPRPESLSPALQGALHQQRQEIAQELHDTLCQSLSGIQLVARMVEKSCAASAEPATIERFKELHGCISQATEELHSLMNRLRVGEPVDGRQGE